MNRSRASWIALGCGVPALLIGAWIGWAEPRQMLLSYLFAFLFFTGLSVGSLALLMIHTLTGGAWGFDLRPALSAAARVLPLLTLLALPLLFGMRALYPWAEAGASTHDDMLRAQRWYLNPVFFIVRTLLYFALWNLLLMVAARRNTIPAAAIGLIVFALTSLLAATDWAMSLLPHWHSTTFGLLVATAWLLSATALAVACAPPAADALTPRRRHDLGNLLLLSVLAWAYLAFMDYLTIWAGDLPAEISWYVPRTLTSWRYLAWLLIAFQFAVPFAMLLSRRAKRDAPTLRRIAAVLLAAGLLNAFWLVVPGLRPQGFALRWTDLLATLGVGALWLCVFLRYPGAGGGSVGARADAPSPSAAALADDGAQRQPLLPAFASAPAAQRHREHDRD